VQAHFGISDREIGILPSSMFTGMMLGAWIWGSFSDSYGRVPAFNGTLALAAVFGGLAGFAPSFSWLCVAFFFLGIGVGGSMPTDGTLFLENVAVRHHYLLTALSVFFSIGAVLASVFAILILPSRSCPTPITEACNLEVDNIGWRILLQASACATLIMFFSRFFLFKLHESPSWLVAEGRETDAAIILEKIAKSNGTEMSFRAEDIAADKPEEATAMLSRNEGDGDVEDQADVKAVRPLLTGLPVSVQTSVSDYMERLDKLFTAPWRRTTVLVWLIWALFSAAFTIFNACVDGLPSTVLPIVIDAETDSCLPGWSEKQLCKKMQI
jgi:MFS family permease